MLGNHADMFMNTPMPTAVTTQAQQAMNMEMPAPRPTTRVGANASFLPGIGNDPNSFMPGFGQYVTSPAYSGTAGLFGLPIPTPVLLVGGGLLAYFLLFRKKTGIAGGRSVRRASPGGARAK